MTSYLETADAVMAALRAHSDPDALAALTRRLPEGEPALGLRMGDLFAVARCAEHLPLREVERLFGDPHFEGRMAAVCVLDFQARRRPGDNALRDCYLAHHDQITVWDMVDRAAPRVVGGTLLGGPGDLLHDLAGSPDPLRRRTAATAPLWFVKRGDETDLVAGFEVVSTLAGDPEEVVTKAVGIYAAHAGKRAPLLLDRFLDEHGATLPRAARSIATRLRRG